MSETSYDRRSFMAYFGSIGLGSTLLPGVLWAQAGQGQQGTPITKEMVAAAEQLAGLSFSDEERTAIARGLGATRNQIQQIHALALPNSVFPALIFDPIPSGEKMPTSRKVPMVRSHVPIMARPDSIDELAFDSVAQLSTLIKARKVKPSELTAMYLTRLKRFDPQLHCVINLTEERARKQAKDADAEIALGSYRGPLHGIPWGAKDLLAVKGYPTTWGAGLYKDQTFDSDAEVVKRLDKAGAILVAKLTLGALAQGDIWFGGQTRNPWDPSTGSSGSSAGPASATAAGCVAFGIGTETNGSITSPSSTCGVSGFRPTFGRIPRSGAMALAWTMDKLGPITRCAEDCALVFDAIQGPDGVDRAVKDVAFNWNAALKPSMVRVGYIKTSFEGRGANGAPGAPDEMGMAVLKALESQGAKLVEVARPDATYDELAASIILDAECGAAFQPDTLNGRIKELETPIPPSTRGYSSWPGTFRAAQFIPAVDYINANRARQLIMKQWWDLFKDHDVIVTMNEDTNATNVTGTPSIAIPIGFAVRQGRGAGAGAGRGGRGGRGAGTRGATDTTPRQTEPPPPPPPPTPRAVRILGALYQDDKVLAVAHAYQQATDFHKRKPPLFV